MSTQSQHVEALQRGIIAWLAEHCGDEGYLGKTALQKLVYALTNLKKVETGYQFSIYNYGPFCKDLAADLDTADLLGAISINFESSRSIYSIRRGRNTNNYISDIEGFIRINTDAFEWVLQNLGRKSARYLELYTTIHYIIENEPSISDEKTSEKLIALKPKFEKNEVLKCIEKVRKDIFASSSIP